MKTKYDWNKSRVEEAVKASISYVETLRRLGINTRGNNTDTLKRKIQEYNIDTSLGELELTKMERRDQKKNTLLRDQLSNLVK